MDAVRDRLSVMPLHSAAADGRTALVIAQQEGDEDVAAWLRDHGAGESAV